MIEKIIPELLAKQRELADTTMRFPQHTDVLLRAGQWQGLQIALEIINAVISEVDKD